MSKIICDVCGTSYPESATQCPICGCVRPADAVAVAGDTDIDIVMSTGSYTYVKGGRFSKSNVRKRNTGKRNTAPVSTTVMDEDEPQKTKSDNGLIVALILLLLAIIAVVIYIAIHFFGPNTARNEDIDNQNPPSSNTQTDVSPDGDGQGEEQTGTDDPAPKPETIPCESLTILDDIVEFDAPGQTKQLEFVINPAETTDEVKFESDSPDVATVTDDGLIMAVGAGEAIIKVSCGAEEAFINVLCNFEQEVEDDPDDQTQTPDDSTLKLNEADFNVDFSFFYVGESVSIYNGDVPVEDIIWTSSDPAIISVENGVVTAVGASFYGDYAVIKAEYKGVVITAYARCHYSAETGIPGNGNVSES